ncbi:hypothetical protein ABZW30_21095 [Kitasatospora sp. NPDC004669]|uniref:hypothetical protein n=1 Tax=Kitasatospora sp. NPDC004669 TaxID=3154555 RepID=UPI0033A9064A
MAGDVTVETIDLGDGTTVRAEVIGEVLSGDVGEGVLLGTVAPQPRTPGRGMYVTPNRRYGSLIQTGWLPIS